VSVHPLAEPEYPFEAVEDGQEFQVGSLSIRVLCTPGHRPEHCCYLVEGKLLTGDSLLIGDAARPDLAVGAEEGAENLFHSLQRLLELPDETEVDPGHTGGSLCAAGISGDRTSTIGSEKLTNHALSIDDVQEFVAHSAGIAAPRPPSACWTSPATCSSSRLQSGSSPSASTSSSRLSSRTPSRWSTSVRRTSATRDTSPGADTSPIGSCAPSARSSTTAGRW